MKARVILAVVLLLLGLPLLVACDPIYPLGNLRVERIQPLSQGESVDLVITYPADGLVTSGWKNQNIEVVSGSDIITVSGLSITGVKSGTATIKVKATTVLNDGADESNYKEKVYSTELKIKVK